MCCATIRGCMFGGGFIDEKIRKSEKSLLMMMQVLSTAVWSVGDIGSSGSIDRAICSSKRGIDYTPLSWGFPVGCRKCKKGPKRQLHASAPTTAVMCGRGDVFHVP
ncbi:unnamed protein product [Ectocarpus sp. 12 AP-2014]